MEKEVSGFFEGIKGSYDLFVGQLPAWLQTVLPLILLVILVFVFTLFVWHFYRFMSRKNVVGLNLVERNPLENSLLYKLLGGFLYLLENVIISPILVFIGFSVFTVFLILLSDSLGVKNILIVSALVIAVVRMAAYYNENFSKELAKLLPLTLLAISLYNPLSLSEKFGQIITSFSKLPTFADKIFVYLGFIIILEILLRFFFFIFGLFEPEEIEHELELENKEKR